jgi:outer membrane usher protein FimD/PapC
MPTVKRTLTVCNDSRAIKTPGVLAGGLLLLVAFANARGAKLPPPYPEPARKTWDMEALKRRGIISAQVENLDKLNEIPKGSSLVDINLNGDFKASSQIQVNDSGVICFTPELFNILGIALPEENSKEECDDWLGKQLDTSVAWQSGSQTLSIIIPPALLQQGSIGDYGGTAGHINYDYYSSLSKNEYQRQRYSWLSLSSGINIANWMIRSQQNIQDNQGEINTTISSTYIERYLGSLNRIFQAGEISTRNTLFPLGRLRGFQLYPDEALLRNSDSGVAIDGMANTPQARVEVRQYDQLIYSTLVAAGPFHLTNIPVQNHNAELDVNVVDTSGERQQFIVPAILLMNASKPESRGFSMSFGKLKNQSSDDANIPAILTLDKDWQSINRMSLRTGSLLSSKYQSVAVAVSGQLASMPSQSFSLQALLVQDQYQHKKSAQVRAFSNHAVTTNLTLSLGASKNTPGYASIEEASLWSRRKDKQSWGYSADNSELSLGASWNSEALGTFSFTHSLTTSYPDNERWRYSMLTWNRRFDNGLQFTTSASQAKSRGRNNKNLNINLSWPLGEKRVRNYYRSSNQRSVIGSDINLPLGTSNNLQLAVEENTKAHNRSLQTSLSSDLRYTNVNTSMQLDNQHQRNYSISGNGSVVAHGRGVTFSNIPVQDTYGILSLNRPLAGVPVITPAGTTWTDWRGMALISSLSPWNDNAIDVDVDKLPKNIDISNGHRTLRPARGTVKQVQMTMLSGNRLLMTLSLANGQLIPKGSTLWMGEKIVAEAVDEGLVFIGNAESKGTFHVKIAQSNEECDVQYQLHGPSDENTLYEQLALTCK